MDDLIATLQQHLHDDLARHAVADPRVRKICQKNSATRFAYNIARAVRTGELTLERVREEALVAGEARMMEAPPAGTKRAAIMGIDGEEGMEAGKRARIDHGAGGGAAPRGGHEGFQRGPCA